MRPPGFWTAARPGMAAGLLTPLSWLWRAGGAWRRGRARPYRPTIPVLCIGNAVMGGAGKTPVARDLALALQQAGHQPHILTRGYGGTVAGPHVVDPAVDTAATVGDEALLLARTAPVWVSRDRPSGARAAEEAGATHIVMDDGFQNPSLHKTVSVLVVDAQTGFGNGCVFPAGPLREPASAALERADVIVLMGDFDCPEPKEVAATTAPRLRAAMRVPDLPLPRGSDCVAFAGIGQPEKFFATAEAIGLKLRGRRSFPDHHPYSDAEMQALVQQARDCGAQLITTEKDAVRVPPRFAEAVTAIPIVLDWQGGRALLDTIRSEFPDVA